ncbi:MAG: hypothetical protein IRY99_25800, partial [Isosphaeraceae bacterium]|nr:hypothetical protein [Isosphaeraceae bacterium]
MAVSEAKCAANRRNALHSTGPTSPEGKRKARANAVKHGLAGAGICLPEDLEAERQKKVAAYTADLGPRTEFERDLVACLATAAVRLARCVAMEEAELGRLAERAARCWAEDRRAEAEGLGERLAKSPTRAVSLLWQSAAGVAWLLERWKGLGRALEQQGGWDEAQWRLASDLLGIAPELRGTDPRLPRTATAAALAELVRREIRRLKRRKVEDLDDLDALEQHLRMRGLASEPGPALQQLRRYEATCDRTWRWALNQFRQRDAEDQSAASASGTAARRAAPSRPAAKRSRPAAEPSPPA